MLFGSCSRCGSCCLVGEYRCDNLEGQIGGATSCRVYEERFNGMPITLINAEGLRRRGACAKGKSEEPRIKELIKEGRCSYWRLW